MKILIIQPPLEDFYLTPIRTYPLGVLYLGTYLKNQGIDIKILDCLNPLSKKTITYPQEFNYLKNFYSEKEIGPLKLFGAYYRFGLSDNEIITIIDDFNPDQILISSNFTAYFEVIAKLCTKIKKNFPHITIAVGGHHANTYKKEILTNYPQIDKVITGSSPQSLLKELNIQEKHLTSWETTIPDRKLIKQNLYKMHKKNFSFVQATKGCPYNCSFCTVKNMDKSFLKRTTQNILMEMKTLYDCFEVRIFDFEDDNLSCDQTWFKELLQKIISTFPKKDIRLYAMNGLAINNLNQEILELMWLAGFRNLNLALVTEQDKIKEKIGRPFNNSQFEKTVNLANKLNFQITAYFILGLPEQTPKEIHSTINYLASLPVLITPSVFYPPPGTKMFDDLVKLNLINPTNWTSFRSSVFPVKTNYLSREELVNFFRYIRLHNFKKELKLKYQLINIDQESLNKISKITLGSINLQHTNEEEIGIAQLKEWLKSGLIKPILK